MSKTNTLTNMSTNTNLDINGIKTSSNKCIESNETKSNETKSNETKSNEIKSNETKSNETTPSIKSFALFISEFFYLFIILIIVLIGIIFPANHKSVKITSKTNYTKWNSTLDPIIFTHISDIHITHHEDRKKYERLFSEAKKLNANFHLLTGDLGDNYKNKHFPKVGKQTYKDWRLYKDLIDTYFYNETVLDIAGNHDMFGVISPLHNRFGFLDVSFSFNRNNTKTLEDFYVKTIQLEGINFILVNPFIFPVVHPPYGFYPHTTKKLLDNLEKAIIENSPCSILIHFPIDFFWWKKSSNGNTIGKMMKKYNIEYIFTGHTHPKKFQIRHHDYGGLEFIGTSTKKSSSFGIVTIDNGRLVYNRVKYKKKKTDKYFMTHPIPVNQIASAQIFNEKNTEIRIISYDENIDNNLIVTGDFNGKMEYQRDLENGAKLYSMPLNITEVGKYKIEVKGENCSIERKFYIGEKYKTKKEKKLLSKAFFRLLFVSGAIILLFLFIIVCPIKFINLDYIDDWIYGKNIDKCYWLQVFLLSPFLLNYRININTPLYFRIILFFFFIYPLVLPFHFFEPIEGHTGYTFFCYIFINKYVIYEEWSIIFNIFYYWGVISPCAILVSGFKFKGSWVYIFNFIYLYIAFVCIWIINFRWAGESVKLLLLFFHPCYIIIPIILNVLIYISLFRYIRLKRDKDKEKDLSNNSVNNSKDITNKSLNIINIPVNDVKH